MLYNRAAEWIYTLNVIDRRPFTSLEESRPAWTALRSVSRKRQWPFDFLLKFATLGRLNFAKRIVLIVAIALFSDELVVSATSEIDGFHLVVFLCACDAFWPTTRCHVKKYKQGFRLLLSHTLDASDISHTLGYMGHQIPELGRVQIFQILWCL